MKDWLIEVGIAVAFSGAVLLPLALMGAKDEEAAGRLLRACHGLPSAWEREGCLDDLGAAMRDQGLDLGPLARREEEGR
jgi:hypothetical protein